MAREKPVGEKHCIAHPCNWWHSCSCRILCRPALKIAYVLLADRAIAAKSQSELDAILPELKAAIKDHTTLRSSQTGR